MRELGDLGGSRTSQGAQATPFRSVNGARPLRGGPERPAAVAAFRRCAPPVHATFLAKTGLLIPKHLIRQPKPDLGFVLGSFRFVLGSFFRVCVDSK